MSAWRSMTDGSVDLDIGLGGVSLPFDAPVLWVLNGDPRLERQGGAQFYGGWAGKQEQFTEADIPFPPGMSVETVFTKDGKSFEAVTARNIIIAPFGIRMSWVAEGTRSSQYFAGGRRHLQVLAILAAKDSKDAPIEYHCPVLLSAKGFQAQHFEQALTRWRNALRKTLRDSGSGAPPWVFYLSIGTFGQDRITERVGSDNRSSLITPITAYIPKSITPDMLDRLYVGTSIVKEMQALREDADEWLKAWENDAVLATPADAPPTIEDDDPGAFGDDDPGAFGDLEIPF